MIDLQNQISLIETQIIGIDAEVSPISVQKRRQTLLEEKRTLETKIITTGILEGKLRMEYERQIA